jgi:hypothetical protein
MTEFRAPNSLLLFAAFTAGRAEAKLVQTSGSTCFAVNRREFTQRGVVIGVNRDGAVDNSVLLIGGYSTVKS